jgi:AraC family ethanolamine operon transcriptional activator
MGSVISCEFRDIDHFREQLRGWDTSAIQVEPGQLSIRLHSIDLEGVIFSDIRVNRRVIDHSRIEDGWLSFVISLSPSIFCGMEVGPGHLAVLGPGREYHSVLATAWHSVEIVIPSSVLADEGLRLAPRLVSSPENAVIPLPVELAGIFARLAQAAFGRNGLRRVDNAWLRSALLWALDRALRIGGRGPRALDRGRRVDGYELARKLTRYAESRFGQRVTVNEVAGELGVTPRALHYAVRSVFGISPLELILAFRLNQARNELWDARSSETSITAVALAQGFGHLGRFSQQYRALFGELPSQMLQRIQLLGEP